MMGVDGITIAVFAPDGKHGCEDHDAGIARVLQLCQESAENVSNLRGT